MSALLDLNEARDRLFALAPALPVIDMPVEASAGYYLAKPLLAQRTQPAHPLSAMDGWAVRQVDMPGPWQITGESAAGHPFGGSVAKGSAIRISTGAIVPAGADMVLVQEDCTRDGDRLTFHGDPPEPLGRHIRTAGLDFTEGQTVLSAGDHLSPARIALAISAGYGVVPVIRKPRITVLDSGDELVPAGNPLRDGQIPASNGPMLAAMLASLPCEITRIGPVADNLDDLIAALESASDADLVITSGGASVGDHDLVRAAIEAMGGQIDFWRVAIKPGKPIMVAKLDGKLILGLPGNPVSAFVTAILFALPLERAMLGAARPVAPLETIRSASPWPATGKRAEFLRGRLIDGKVERLSVQDSGALLPLAMAEVLVFRPPHAPASSPDDIVEFIRIPD